MKNFIILIMFLNLLSVKDIRPQRILRGSSKTIAVPKCEIPYWIKYKNSRIAGINTDLQNVLFYEPYTGDLTGYVHPIY